MRQIVVLGLVLTLAGCATVQERVCKNASMLTITLELAYQQALLIVDPVKRESALSTIRVSQAALDTCP